MVTTHASFPFQHHDSYDSNVAVEMFSQSGSAKRGHGSALKTGFPTSSSPSLARDKRKRDKNAATTTTKTCLPIPDRRAINFIWTGID